MRLSIAFLLFFLSCGMNQNSNVVSTSSRTSSCGGFSSLAKKAMIPYAHDSLEYCRSGKLMWSYSPTDKKLEFLLLRTIENCAAQLELTVVEQNGKYEIHQKDNSHETADCMCVFDTYCTVPNVQKDLIIIGYEDLVDTLDLRQGSGAVIIDTNSYCEKYPFQ